MHFVQIAVWVQNWIYFWLISSRNMCADSTVGLLHFKAVPGVHHTLIKNPLKKGHFQGFFHCMGQFNTKFYIGHYSQKFKICKNNFYECGEGGGSNMSTWPINYSPKPFGIHEGLGKHINYKKLHTVVAYWLIAGDVEDRQLNTCCSIKKSPGYHFAHAKWCRTAISFFLQNVINKLLKTM